jgi:hypothetical protein
MDHPHLVIHLHSDNPVDAERLDEAIQTLRSDLLDIDGVRQVAPVGEESPPGSKSVSSLADASLYVAAGVTGRAVASQIAAVIVAWLARNQGKRLALRRGPDEVEMEGYGEAEVVKVVQSAFRTSTASPTTARNDLAQQQ